jgi:hypothetical protein
LGVTNSWAAYQFDNAVAFVGVIIENALAERVEIGPANRREWREKYTLAQLLDSRFRLPRPVAATPGNALASFVEELKAYAGRPGSGIRMWQYVGPEPGKAQ